MNGVNCCCSFWELLPDNISDFFFRNCRRDPDSIYFNRVIYIKRLHKGPQGTKET